MNYLDIIFIAFFAYLAIMGLRKGFIKQVFDIIAILVGIYLGHKYFYILTLYFTSHYNMPVVAANFLGFLIVFFLVFFLVSFAGVLANKIIGISFLNTYNRLFGLILGLVKGSLLAIIVLMPLYYFNLASTRNSLIANSLKTTIQPIVYKYIAKEVAKTKESN
jgi:membrane protein required for colicin V production